MEKVGSVERKVIQPNLRILDFSTLEIIIRWKLYHQAAQSPFITVDVRIEAAGNMHQVVVRVIENDELLLLLLLSLLIVIPNQLLSWFLGAPPKNHPILGTPTAQMPKRLLQAVERLPQENISCSFKKVEATAGWEWMGGVFFLPPLTVITVH